ncbi:MAG: FKBP-type peptidyl-prolyl cis-trans isomerase [Bacteroidales bacterium]|nr:FKBP-type peptidyl-prolyl cis-trans isomerase [Bacteroidales bacterium]
MKTTLIAFSTLLLTINISAQQQPAELSSPFDTLQYSLGVFVGQWLTNNSFTVTNIELFNRGMSDILQNNPRAITDSTIAPLIASYQLSTQNEKSRQMETQLFDELRGKAGVGALPNGVHYMVMNAGSGIRPTANDSIVINAIGVFPDGTLFEDTYQKGQPINIITSNLIPGLNEAIQLMPEGSKWRIFIPSALAYGTAGIPDLIPPNTALVFEITLERVKVNIE